MKKWELLIRKKQTEIQLPSLVESLVPGALQHWIYGAVFIDGIKLLRNFSPAAQHFQPFIGRNSEDLYFEMRNGGLEIPHAALQAVHEPFAMLSLSSNFYFLRIGYRASLVANVLCVLCVKDTWRVYIACRH